MSPEPCSDTGARLSGEVKSRSHRGSEPCRSTGVHLSRGRRNSEATMRPEPRGGTRARLSREAGPCSQHVEVDPVV
jgi:hypothetical protein